MHLPARLALVCLLLLNVAPGQDYYSNQIVKINELPNYRAASTSASDVLIASAQAVFANAEICCEKNSALDDIIRPVNPRSLVDISSKLQGHYVLRDGRSVDIDAACVPASSLNSGEVISALGSKHAFLMEWNSRLYIVYGVVFNEMLDAASGAKRDTIRKFLLIDTRFSDERRFTSFDREKEDWASVGGVLFFDVLSSK
jgi:hypothetical protein